MEVAAEQVIVNRGGRPVLAGVTVRAHAGQSLALVGPSGSGKTTLLNVLGLLQRTDGGHVKIDGQDATRWTDGQRRRFWQKHATFVFQDYGLIDDQSVAYNVVLARLPLLGLRAAEVRAVDAVLERVGLCGRAREQVSSLSGGEKQRVGLARAMYRQADVIFADEPTASLDRVNRDHVTGFLHGEAARGATVIIATHDDALMRACDTRIDLVAPAV